MRVLAAARPEVLLEAAPLAARERLERLPLLSGHDRLDLFEPIPVASAQVVLGEGGDGEREYRNRGATCRNEGKAGGNPRLIRHKAS